MGFLLSLIASLVAFTIALVRADIAGEKYRASVRSILLLVGAIATIATLWQFVDRFLVIVPSGNAGVEEVFGKVSKRSLPPGIHIVNPLGETIEFSTRLQDIKETLDVTTQEGLTITMDVSLQYRIAPEQAPAVYQNIGKDVSQILVSRFRSIVRETTSSYEASAIYGGKRQELTQRLQAKLQEQLTPLGLIVEQALLRNVTLPDKLQETIEEKLAAEQESLKAEFELEKTRQEAERKRIEARGIADARRTIAEGLTEELLRLEAIEATSELARSDNTKVIVIGGEGGLPLILPDR